MGASATKKQRFIDELAVLIQKYAPHYGIRVVSPILAQACKESSFGTSELAMNAFNPFGLKFKDGRCPSALPTPYYKEGSEQLPDGSYVSSAMKWFQFENFEKCVKGYFDFINISRYSNLKEVTDPYTYCQLIKEDGYATSLTYASSLYNDYIIKYNLTKYDLYGLENEKENKEPMATKKKVVAINAGHWEGNPKGVPKSMPVLGGTREWFLNKRVVDKFVELAKPYNFDVVLNFDTTGKNGGVGNQLADRVKMAEQAKADIYLSIHHNGGINGGTGGGLVVFHYNTSKNKAQATKIYNEIIARTGKFGNRSTPIKADNSYYEIYKPTMPSFIVECAFMDSTKDVYMIAKDEWPTQIAEGLLAFLVSEFGFTNNSTSNTNKAETTPTPTPTPTPQPVALPYKAKVLVASLPIYRGPSTNYGIAKYIKDKGVYTIVDESNGFGKLKSGAGWIQLSQTKKI